MTLTSSTRQYTSFWATVIEQWHQRWPTLMSLLPDRSESDLTEQEREQVAQAMQATTSRLKTWFRWRANASKNSSGRRRRKKGTDELIQEVFQDDNAGRKLKEYEMYSKLHYEEHIKKHVHDKIAQETEKLAPAEKLTPAKRLEIIKSTIREVYNEEDEAVKEVVRQRLEEHNRKIEEGIKEPSQRTPEDYARAIEDCATVLEKILTPLSHKTGWKFLVLMGGPDPGMGGKITAASYNEGVTKNGKTFAETYLDFKKYCLTPYTTFLEGIYCERLDP
ncbi:hypothetical protein NLJ89_g11825 [Agrocybe chaxingu]|uniref:Uncharacterized protein n=1 Tax=Agrocybe chaxingu TaxID=84603 RepID=A0A9W8JPB8_9AGAR|nr:hypothetical protein NLJ89_g11825 [Agrocybe chaxingu]